MKKLYMLWNGNKSSIMAVPGPLSPVCVARTIAKVHETLKGGDRQVISEITIDPDAVETIVDAIMAFNDRAVPLVTALSELIAFSRRFDWEDARRIPAELLPDSTTRGTIDSAISPI